MHPLQQWQLAAQRRDSLLARAHHRSLVQSAGSDRRPEGLPSSLRTLLRFPRRGAHRGGDLGG